MEEVVRFFQQAFAGHDLTVWLATNAKTRKVGQIRRNPRVALFYLEPPTGEDGPMGYITIIGEAHLVDDSGQKARRWKEEWKDIYEDENRGKDYLLIKVIPKRIEVVFPGIETPDWGPAIVEIK